MSDTKETANPARSALEEAVDKLSAAAYQDRLTPDFFQAYATAYLSQLFTAREEELSALKRERDEAKEYVEEVFENYTQAFAEMVAKLFPDAPEIDSTPGETEHETRSYIIGQSERIIEERFASLKSKLSLAVERYENRVPTQWAYDKACVALNTKTVLVKNLAMLVTRLCSKDTGHSEQLRTQALDFIQRNDLIPSPLRAIGEGEGGV